MKRTATFTLALLLANVCFSNPGISFENYHSGHYAAANTELTELAKKNNSEALFYLANMNLYGFGIKRNPQAGLELMIRSAKLKFLPAILYLGNYYFQQKHDLITALDWYKQADNANAQLFVGLAYLNGYGTKKNVDIARKYIILAAKSGIPMAEYELAVMFFDSKHASDKKIAMLWLKRSAEKNYADAEYLLGTMLYTGTNFDKDQSAGIEWLQKAIKQGHKEAQTFLTASQTPGSTVKAMIPTDTTPTQLSNDQQWSALNTLLNKANVTLNNATVATAANDEVTKTPTLVMISKSSIVQPNFSIITPKEIPMGEIILYVSKLDYAQQKPVQDFPSYSFIMPAGTSTYQEAYNLLSQQAKFGNPLSLFLLGQMYEQGLGVEKNNQTAFNYFLQSAEQNYLKAQYMVGIYYLQGKAVEKNPQLAINWLAKSALHGSAEAQFVLGSIYEYGIHSGNIPKDPSVTQGMYSLAAEAGFSLAENRLAQLYASGTLNPNHNSEVQKSDLATAFRLFQTAANRGIENAKISLAYFYAEPHQGQFFNQQALTMAEKMAEQDNPNADLLLAILYDRGIGTSESHRKAMKYYKKLLNSNNAIAEFMLGTHYYLDNEMPEAIALLEKSAAQGNAYALFNLAILSHKNQYQQSGQDYIALLTKAANSNLNRASLLLADHYLMDSNDPAAIRQAATIYQQLAEKQDSTAELKLGYMYEQGIFFEKNFNKANEWYQRSANHNNPVAQYLLGNLFQFGKGVDRNINQAIQYYLKSAAQNYVPAQVALGFIYEQEKHDYSKAREWYTKAAEANNPEAQYDLSLMYEYGKGVEINPRKSHQLYKEATQNGFDFATINQTPTSPGADLVKK